MSQPGPSHRAFAPRQQALADMEATIAAHVPDLDGCCLGCRENGEDETYPCQRVAFALQAADLLARRLAGSGNVGETSP